MLTRIRDVPARAVHCALALALSTTTACVGRSVAVGPADSGGDTDQGTDTANDAPVSTSAGSAGDETGDVPEPTCSISIGHSPGRALDEKRWRNTVHDLLGIEAEISLWPWHRGPAYPVQVADEQLAGDYEEAAQAVAEQVDLGALLGCDEDATGQTARVCILELVTTLGRLAWRRSLTEDEFETLVGLEADEPAGVRARAVVRTLFSSPNFWIVDESGTEDPLDPGTVVLDDHAIAARMAYFLWNSTPDETLLGMADFGSLAEPAVRHGEVVRMMSDPRAARAIGDYWERVLDIHELDRLPKTSPEWDDALARAMTEESRRFVADVVLGEGDWATLLSAPRSFQNAHLASTIYAGDIVGSVPTTASHELVQLDPARRPGLLTRAAVMSRWPRFNSIGFDYRGLFVAQRLLCAPLPPPPDSFEFDPIDFEPLTRREAFDAYLAPQACSTCHLFFTPITPGFDHYDPIGRWQTELTTLGAPANTGHPTHPVEPHGVIHFTDGRVESFADHHELMDLLIDDPLAHACVVRGQLEFALGRHLEEADACTLEHLGRGFEQSGANLRQLIEEIVASDAFVRARP